MSSTMRWKPLSRSLVSTTARPSVLSASVRSDSTRARTSCDLVGRPQHGVLVDVAVEGGQAPGVHRIEADVVGVGDVHQVPIVLRVVQVRQHLPIGLAVVLRVAVVAAHAIRGDAPVWRRADLRRAPAASRMAPWRARFGFGREQEPAVGDRDHGLALVAQPAQVPRQVLQAVEHALLAPALNHLVGDARHRNSRGSRDLRVVVGRHGALSGRRCAPGSTRDSAARPGPPDTAVTAAPRTSTSTGTPPSSSNAAPARGRGPTCPASSPQTGRRRRRCGRAG